MALFLVCHIFFNFKKINNKKILSYLFVASIIFSNVFNFNIYYSDFLIKKSATKLSFKLNDLKNLKQKEFICPNDIKGVNSHKDAGAALSGILLKPYYSDSLIKDKYFNWDNISLRYAVLPKQKVNNPCNK